MFKKTVFFLFLFFQCQVVSAYTSVGNKRCTPAYLLGRYFNAGNSTCYLYVYEPTAQQYWRHNASSCPTDQVCQGLCTGETTYYSTYNITGDAYLGTCFIDPDCLSNVPYVDTDNDGASDFCEANFPATSWQEMWNPNIISPCQAVDSDSDGISDTTEALLGTDPEDPDEMCSANYTNYAVTNYDPVEHTYSVGFYLTDDRFYVLDIFSIPAMPAFGTPYSYTLGNYGEIPCAVTLTIYEYADGIPTFEVSPLSDPGDSTGPVIDWNDLELVEYDGDSGIPGVGDDVTQGYDNSETATEVWDNLTTPLPNITLPRSTSATVAIDPKDIAQGVALALNHVQTSSITDISEEEDASINWAIISAQGLISGFGDTGFNQGDVLTSSSMTSAIGFLSWVDDLYTIPTIGSQSLITINGFSFLGQDFDDIEIDFDLPLIPYVRALFLFCFYLSCVWIFFRLTRYAWG